MYTFLECIPDELSLRILNNLKVRDLLTCRLVSTPMCDKIDRLFSTKFCIILNEKSEQHFINARTRARQPLSYLTKHCINPKFRTMKVGSLACCSKWNHGSKWDDGSCNFISLRPEQFAFITELEFSHSIRKAVFQQIIKITEMNLRTLTINSGVLGGAANLFEFNDGQNWKDDSNKTTKKSGYIIERMSTLWKYLIPFRSFKRRRNPKPIRVDDCSEYKEGLTLLNLKELHIKITYVAATITSERMFSPHILIENMNSLRFLPAPNLQACYVNVERSDDGELFYLTINSLLQTIPVLAYESLKSLTIISPKLKPHQTSMESDRDYDYLADFKIMKLSELTVRILGGYSYPKPTILRYLLSTQSATLRTVILAGFSD